MAHLPLAPAGIQAIHMLLSRRTSKALFYQNLAIVLADYRARLDIDNENDNDNDNNNRQQQQLDPLLVLAAHEEVLYAFNIFQQLMQQVKFPVTSEDIWPTISHLEDELGGYDPLPLSTDGFHYLEKVDLCICSINQEAAEALEIVRLFQQIQSVKFLTLNLEILEIWILNELSFSIRDVGIGIRDSMPRTNGPRCPFAAI
ncbi:hypothetical protein Tco_1197578, partial [Tanacetum coccineum]